MPGRFVSPRGVSGLEIGKTGIDAANANKVIYSNFKLGSFIKTRKWNFFPLVNELVSLLTVVKFTTQQLFLRQKISRRKLEILLKMEFVCSVVELDAR